jgi:hypothetical protein
MPVALMMALYRKHAGTHGVRVIGAPEGLDVAASMTGGRLFLHIVNTHRHRPVEARFEVPGQRVKAGRVFWFALEPELEIIDYQKDQQLPQQKPLDIEAPWAFPAASVSAVELDFEPGNPGETAREENGREES